MKKLILIGIICLLTVSGSLANNTVTDSLANVTSIEESARFNADSATQAYLNTMTPEQKEQSDSYFEGGYWIQLWGLILEIIIAWIFLSLGLSRWIRKIAFKTKNVNVQNLIYIGLYMLIAYLLIFPFNIYISYYREHQYNLSNLTIGSWFSEEMKGLAISVIAMSFLFTIIYIVIRKVQKNWWIWGTGIFMVFVVLMMFIAPVFISPLFNEYKPLAEGQLKQEILSMARANGVPADNVYQFDASKQSKRISANVSGIGSTIRISLNDNLLNRCTQAEIKAVMGHEIGHYVLNHIYSMMIYFSIIIILGFAFINWAFKKMAGKYGDKWQITGIADIGGFPLIMVLFTLYFFIATPLINTVIRTQELEADIFGLNAAREPDGSASVDMMLSEYRKIDPSRFEEIIFFDHPSGRTRVHNAMQWKAEYLDE